MRKKAAAFIMLITLMTSSLTANAMDKGAYLVSRKTSYVNPDTNTTMDGGTNIALGDSMCDSIVDDQVLVEKTNEKMYITVGLGLMSNVSDVSMQVVNEKGEFRDVELTLTGSCERDNDTCNHYRFEMGPDDKYFSPILYVTPMGREVQFFVSIDYASAKEGTGDFLSEMLVEKSEPKNVKYEIKKEENKEKTKDKNENTKVDNNFWIPSAIVVIVIAGAIVLIVKKKRG